MNIRENLKGLQHIGLPTDCFEKTITFYEGLGFVKEYETFLKDLDQRVAFLQMDNLVLEIYEEKDTVKRAGAIDHFSLDCTDVEKVYGEIKDNGYEIVSKGIESLPFWENGIKFFIIEGPNKEKIEFCQIL